MSNETPKCPCKDCITLSICKAKINNKHTILGIAMKCEILKDYLHNQLPRNSFTERYYKVIKILQLHIYSKMI